MSYLDRSALGFPDEGGGYLTPGITLTMEEAEAVGRLLSKLVGKERAVDKPALLGNCDGDRLRSMARTVYNSRRKRNELFGAVLFGEYAWDMLLVLYIYGDHGERLSVTRLAEFCEAPLTTAIRWLEYLEDQKLVVREQSPTDRRKYFVGLSDKGRTALNAYFRDVLNNTTQPAI